MSERSRGDASDIDGRPERVSFREKSSRGLLRAGVHLLLNKAGGALNRFKGRGGKLTWTGVDQAQRAKATAIGVKNRKPGIKADSRFAGDQRVVRKPVVKKRVRTHQAH